MEFACHAVVVRSDAVSQAWPWPHWIGASPTEERRADFVAQSTSIHPYRRGEFLRTIALTGALDRLEVGTVMAAIAAYGRADDDEVEASAAAAVRRILDCEQVIVGGGIEVSVDGEVVVTPQCCGGLEQWREWLEFLDGGPEPWGGHGPMLRVTRMGSGAIALGYEDSTERLVAPERLRAALEAVEAELAAFTALLAGWAEVHVPGLADALVDKLGHDLALRSPR
ncbi:hypothetical protein [Nannocystis punicea]|uniref:SUKH-4 immunity protein of toxin-antitoxin system n=1 Tax=Nannocystis punicea TaxID=2995304 RepID=A0ABY7HA22_9BACT|nr:hypothetical protein [Nannocystis poenicansa]WAS95957.1 hypothetical protein O0S08_07310 [Nannocystis poenicansa]